MKQIWCISAPLLSHTDWGGFLETAQTLKQLGHNVLWISGDALASKMSEAGLPFQAIRETGWLWPPPPPPDLSTIPPQEAVQLRYKRALDTWLSEDIIAEATNALIELASEIGSPDIIITDPFLTASALAAERLNARLVVAGWHAQRSLDEGLLFPVQRNLGTDSQQRVQRLCDAFDLQGVNFSKGPTPSIVSPQLHICYFTRNWYVSDWDTLLPQNIFVGGSPTIPHDAPPDWLAQIPDDVPLAVITLGSIFTGDLGFFSWAAQSAAREGLTPVIAIGWNPIVSEKKTELISALPKGTRLLNWIPLDHVLPRTKLIIHHGGMGTTHHAVVHAVQQIVVPHAADQRIQAKRVAQAKVGLHLSAHDVRQGMLSEGTRAILHDRQIYQTARNLADEMENLGGSHRAAEAILNS
jgi:MGT family glycosyltransferase